MATILIIFTKNKLTKLTNFVRFIRMFCLKDWGLGSLPPGYATVLSKVTAEWRPLGGKQMSH